MFELFNQSEYYKSLDENEYNDSLRTAELVEIPSKYLDTMRDMLSEYVSKHKYSRELSNLDGSDMYVISDRFPHKYFHIEFYMEEDEWFSGFYFDKEDRSTYIQEYYKCDGFEGLLRLLKDKGII